MSLQRRKALRRGALRNRRHGDQTGARAAARAEKRLRKALRRAARKSKAADWRLVESKPLVLNRARGRCERCSCRVRPDRVEVHHIVPRSRGVGWPGLHEPENLVALCNYCHRAIHEHRVPDWRTWLRPRPLDEDAA